MEFSMIILLEIMIFDILSDNYVLVNTYKTVLSLKVIYKRIYEDML